MENNIFQTPERHGELPLDEIKKFFDDMIEKLKSSYPKNQEFEIIVDRHLYRKFEVKKHNGCRIILSNISPGNVVIRPRKIES